MAHTELITCASFNEELQLGRQLSDASFDSFFDTNVLAYPAVRECPSAHIESLADILKQDDSSTMPQPEEPTGAFDWFVTDELMRQDWRPSAPVDMSYFNATPQPFADVPMSPGAQANDLATPTIKCNTSQALSRKMRRQEQNRVSQKAFRERRVRETRELQAQVRGLLTQASALEAENGRLQASLREAHAEIEALGSRQRPVPESSTARSEAVLEGAREELSALEEHIALLKPSAIL